MEGCVEGEGSVAISLSQVGRVRDMSALCSKQIMEKVGRVGDTSVVQAYLYGCT